MRARKGQVEIMVIISVIIIAVIAVTVALQQSAITPLDVSGLEQEVKTVKDSVTSLIRSGIKENMMVLYNQGGTLSPAPSVKFGMSDTHVWSACGETNIPDVSKEIGSGVLSYLNENLDEEMEFFGKTVKFDLKKAKTEVNILEDSVKVKVYLPTTVENYAIQEPYEVSVATNLHDILEFSENFVNDINSGRYFEGCTLMSMQRSESQPGHWIKLVGTQTDCGSVLFKTRDDLLPALKGIIRYTVEHVVWNAQPLKLSSNHFCLPIYQVGGKSYPDLDVAFAYPPSWDSELEKQFTFSPDPLRVVPTPFIGTLCMGAYQVLYSFRYPVVIMVEDKKTNQWFNFAVFVDIQDSMPGDCSADFGTVSGYHETCDSAECSAKVTVNDSSGSPIEGAYADYGGCSLGLTDGNGVAEGKAPCRTSELNVYKAGYRSFSDVFNWEEVEDIGITLEKTEEVKIHLNGLNTEAKNHLGNGVFEEYSVKSGPQGFSAFSDYSIEVFLTFEPTDPNPFTYEDTSTFLFNYDDDGNIVSEIEKVHGLQPIEYNVSVNIIAKKDVPVEDISLEDLSSSGLPVDELPVDDLSLENLPFVGIPLGRIETTFTLKEGEKDVYVNVPLALNVINMEDTVGINDEKLVKGFETSCGIKPVSTEPQKLSNSCTVK